MKRKNKLEKRELKRLKRAKMAEQSIYPVENPYDSKEAALEDSYLLMPAWEKHYGKLPEDFTPPLFEQDAEGFKMAAWVATYRDMLLDKYGTMEIVEPRVKFIFSFLTNSMLEKSF